MGLAAAVVVAALVAGPAPALAAPDPAYAFTLRAAAVEPYARAARELPFGVGFSSVDLTRAQGAGRCDAVGAGYWLGVYEDRGLVFDGSMPHRGDGPAGRNPTAARVTRPSPVGPGEDWADHVPAVPAGGAGGPRWTAACDEGGGAGRSTGIGLDGPVVVAGSTSGASVADGSYRGGARAYVQGLGPSTGALSSLTTAFLVTAHIGDEPVISYEITWARADPGSGVGADVQPRSVTLAGDHVPAGDLVGQFARQAERYASDVADLASVGVTLLAPDVSVQDGRTAVTAPALAVGAGLAGRRNLAGQEQGVRLGSATFTCLCRLQ